jgi:hypothetical protein
MQILVMVVIDILVVIVFSMFLRSGTLLPHHRSGLLGQHSCCQHWPHMLEVKFNDMTTTGQLHYPIKVTDFFCLWDTLGTGAVAEK